MSINSRNKGKAFELQLAKILRPYFPNIATSRLMSKYTDDMGVDFVGTDCFNIQAKAVEKLGNLHSILDKMPKDEKYNLVVHKRNRQGIIVAMALDDFLEILQMLQSEQILTAPTLS